MQEKRIIINKTKSKINRTNPGYERLINPFSNIDLAVTCSKIYAHL